MMNALLQRYIINTEFPEVSGAEHLETLQMRDRLLELESTLSPEEKEHLAQAVSEAIRRNRRFIQHAPQVLQELSQFVDLATQRRIQDISAERWWWYLDVLAQATPFARFAS
jgi:hypothetical protein